MPDIFDNNFTTLESSTLVYEKRPLGTKGQIKNHVNYVVKSYDKGVQVSGPTNSTGPSNYTKPSEIVDTSKEYTKVQFGDKENSSGSSSNNGQQNKPSTGTNNNNNLNVDNTSKPESTETKKEQEIIKSIKEIDAKRHVIKVEDISLERNEYQPKTVIKTNNLIKEPTNKIAFFCNEYFPSNYSKGNSIKYQLEVNGSVYEIVPINSNDNGIKIIKTSDLDLKSDYVKYISEKIKEAYLTITLTAFNKHEAPSIANLKILLGNK